MLTILDAKNPRWVSEDHSYLDIDVMFEGYEAFGLSAFTTHAEADTEHGLELWEKAIAGEYGLIAAYVATAPAEVITVLPSVTLWERLTPAEAEQVHEIMGNQPVRTRKIFETANTFRSDHELWPLLVQIATELFGEARAGELLAQ